MTKPIPHVYAEMITEWAKDTRRIVQYSHNNIVWRYCEDNDPSWNLRYYYRFADTVKKVVISLSDDEIYTAISKIKSQNMSIGRTIADLAATRERENIKNIPAVSSMTKDDFSKLYGCNELTIANAAIAKFLE